jgi:D-alanyl-D-alanine carboxypeptidase
MTNRPDGGISALQSLVASICVQTVIALRKRLAAALLLFACMLAVAGTAGAQDATLVLNANTGDILYSYQEDDQLHPASLTKMMTLYMAFEALRKNRIKPDQALKVSSNAASQPPSRLGLKAGTTIKAKDAILALITKSANDAAVVLAEAMADAESDFARAMTHKARKLGMADTVFRNASGLHEDGQVTTARAVARLAMSLLRDHPDYYKQFATRSFSWHGRRYANHNPLLSTYKGADGIKTGYIRQSGYNLVGSAERDGQRIIAVVLGSRTPGIRDWTMTTLLDYGFEQIVGNPTLKESRSLPYITNPTGEMALKIAIRGAANTTMFAKRNGSRGTSVPAVLTVASKTQSVVSTGGKGWAVQVGAYPTTPPAEDAASRAKAKIPKLLGGTRLSLPQTTRDGSRFYRARLVGLTESQARTACRRLADHNIPCLTVGEDGEFKTSLVQ